MFTKQPYLAPETVILPLHTEGAILTGSINQSAMGADITFLGEETFNDFFVL